MAEPDPRWTCSSDSNSYDSESRWAELGDLDLLPPFATQPTQDDTQFMTYSDDAFPALFGDDNGQILGPLDPVEALSPSVAAVSFPSPSNSTSITHPQAASDHSTVGPSPATDYTPPQYHHPYSNAALPRYYPIPQGLGPRGLGLEIPVEDMHGGTIHNGEPIYLDGDVPNSPLHGKYSYQPDTAGDLNYDYVDEDDDPVTAAIPGNQSYAKWLEQMFKSKACAPMALKDIYKWFLNNTPKTNNSKGWQNSVRHNLSMNKEGFEKEPVAGASNSKRSNSTRTRSSTTRWQLTEWAFIHGVKPTTHYRKPPKGGKATTRNTDPAPNRQVAGKRGGQVTSANRMQRTRSNQVTSAPTRRRRYQQYHHDTRYATPMSYTSSASPATFHSVSSTSHTPHPLIYHQDFTPDTMSFPPTSAHVQTLTPAYSPSYAPVGQYQLPPFLPSSMNYGNFRSFDAHLSPALSSATPDQHNLDDSFGNYAPSSHDTSQDDVTEDDVTEDDVIEDDVTEIDFSMLWEAYEDSL